MPLKHKDLLGIADLSVEEINLILDTAETFRDINTRRIKKVPTLRGKTIINLFFEASTRTRTSFEIAAKRLSADAINISASTSSVVKGETLIDTALNLQAMSPDAIVIRHSSSGAPHALAQHVQAGVVNAGDGAHEHPTQALLDALTIRQNKHRLAGLKVAIIGDVLHSRVARSNAHLLSKLGAHVVFAGPRTLLPFGFEKLLAPSAGSVTFAPHVNDAIADADVVMMLRIQLERQSGGFFPSLREYSTYYGLNRRRLALAKPGAIVMHPGPINRGVEIDSDVADGPFSLILDQVNNGVSVRMAVLYLLAGANSRISISNFKFEIMASLLIKNGTLIDPTQHLEARRDLLIRDGKVEAIDESISAENVETFDATGLIVAPGFIDLHVHLREPGFEYKETIETGARAAVAGGFTSVCCMPNTKPVNDNSSVTNFIIEQARKAGLANVFPIGAITQGSKGEHLAEIGEMQAAGIVAISDDGKPVVDSGIMRRALEYACDFDLPVVDHCEDCCGATGWAMHEGEYSALMGLKGLPGLAEDLHVSRDIMLAEITGARVHIAHLSTARSVELVRAAKARGLAVSCEVAPHHFTLTDRDVFESRYDTNFKMAPPLRAQSDVEAILEGLRDGTIDAIATDHAPHHANEKMLEFDRAPNGIIGLETAISLTLDRLVHRGVISLARMVELLSCNPARLFSLARGTLKAGAVGDVTIFDPAKQVKVDAGQFQSKSRNTPFDGWELRGAPVATIVAGRWVWVANGERGQAAGKA